MSIDLNILSLCRKNGQEQTGSPGLMAYAPPRKTARGREREALLISFLLSGNTDFSNEEYEALMNAAAAAFHGTHGALTAALRAAAESLNRALLERNLSTTGRGQYAIGWLTLAGLRETQLTILQCGPTHVIASGSESRHLHDPALSGKGLGLSQSISKFFSQINLNPGDRLLICPKLPPAWENALASDRGLPGPESTRRRMMALAEGDVSGALIYITEGSGQINLAKAGIPPPLPLPVDTSPAADSAPAPAPSKPAHVVGHPSEQPSAYAIPPQIEQTDEELLEQLASAAMARQFPPSIPRAQPPEPDMEALREVGEDEETESEETEVFVEPRPSPEEIALRRAESQRRMASTAVSGIQAWRRVTGRIGVLIRRFLPNLLPGGESDLSLPVPAMAFISFLVPILMATIGVVVYLQLGVSAQYETYIRQAETQRVQALNETNPAIQRDAWRNVLKFVAQAESLDGNPKTRDMRQEAQSHLDVLEGIARLNFSPLFNPELSAEISRMAASDTDLYMLDATQGSILRAAVTGRGYELDGTFDCQPGKYGNTTVGSLVDLLVLPKLNTLNSSVLGVDAAGNLLYCAPGQVAQAMAFPPPPTNWNRITAMTFDSGRLYALDAPAKAVWIYTDTDGVFIDPPLFFFGNQIPEIQDAIDIAVNGDNLYLLHADGHLTRCTYSRIDNVPTRCDAPAPVNQRFPAYGETDVFSLAHFTQMILTGLPDPVLLLLDADGQSVYRLGSRSFELHDILRAPFGVIPSGALGAISISPELTLYVASGGQVYAASNAP